MFFYEKIKNHFESQFYKQERQLQQRQCAGKFNSLLQKRVYAILEPCANPVFGIVQQSLPATDSDNVTRVTIRDILSDKVVNADIRYVFEAHEAIVEALIHMSPATRWYFASGCADYRPPKFDDLKHFTPMNPDVMKTILIKHGFLQG